MRLGALLFDAFMYPLERMGIRELRRKIISRATGDVLEIGAGTGVNLKHFNPEKINSMVISDYSLNKDLYRRIAPLHCPVSLMSADVQALPFPDETFDSVISTLIFCSVSDPLKGFEEIHRVLKPKGRFFFIEHVLSESRQWASMQHLVNPGWNKISRGCNLNRKTEELLDPAGFRLTERYIKGYGILLGGIAIKKGEIA